MRTDRPDHRRLILQPHLACEVCYLDLAARVAGAHGASIRLLGSTGEPLAGNGDATSLLADAALVVQQLTGVATEPVLVSPDGVAEMGRKPGSWSSGSLINGALRGWGQSIPRSSTPSRFQAPQHAWELHKSSSELGPS